MKIPKHGHALTATERLGAQIGLSPSAFVRRGQPPDSWAKWDTRFGPWFRLAHGLELPGDAERIATEPASAGELPLPPGL